MPELHKREKVLVQYRLLKDFDELSRRGIPGIDVRVMEHNIYEWHVTMSPISGHFAGLRLHLVLLFPEDYPRHPPKVELCTRLPHANVFKDMLSFAGFWAGYQPKRGSYVICTDLLEDKPLPIDPADSSRYDGWSVAYSVESVLVQLQCLLFDDYLLQEDGSYINTLWDNLWGGRRNKHSICQELHAAQTEADKFCCPDCGYSGSSSDVAFYDVPLQRDEEDAEEDNDEDDEVDADDDVQGDDTNDDDGDRPPDAAADEASQPKKNKFASRKKQRKQTLKKGTKQRAKVDFNAQNLYLELSNANSALVTGHALRRVPGVFKPRDVVSFHFHGVEDETYTNGRLNLNCSLQILNYGHEVQFPWCTYDIVTGKTIYHKLEPEAKEGEEKKANKGKTDWERFENSQGGGSSKKPEDTPGTEAYVRKREKFHQVGVVEFVDAYSGVVTIVVAGKDGKLGSSPGRHWRVTDEHGEFPWNTEVSSGPVQATLYKNVPMEKVKLHGYEKERVPYEHEPPSDYKPFVAKFYEDLRVEYDLEKDAPTKLVKLLEGHTGLTKQHLAALPEEKCAALGGPNEGSFAMVSGVSSQSFALVDGQNTEQSFEIVSVLGGSEADFEVLSSHGNATASSFDIISVIEKDGSRSGNGSAASVRSSFHLVPSRVSSGILSHDLASSEQAISDAAAVDDAALASLASNADSKARRRHGTSESGSSVSQIVSQHSLLSLWNRDVHVNSGWDLVNSNNSWELLKALAKLNVPIRGEVKSLQNFGAFVSIDATPRNLAVRNGKLLPGGGSKPKGKGKGKGKGSKDSDAIEQLQDGLLPWLPYMRTAWTDRAAASKSNSPMVLGNAIGELARVEDPLLGPQEMVVYVSDVDTERKRLKLSLQPRLVYEHLRLGEEYDGIVVDCSKQATLGLFVALSDDLVGLVHRTQFGAGDYVDELDDQGWYKRCTYKVGDQLKVYVVKKAVLGQSEAGSSRAPKRNFKIDLTMDSGNAEVRKYQQDKCLQVLDDASSIKQCGGSKPTPEGGKTVMDLQLQQSYDEEDKFFLIKNNRLIRQAEDCYPNLVIDYTTDPPPPPPAEEKEKEFDFSLIKGWQVRKIIDEHKRLTEKKEAYDKAAQTKPIPKDVKPLSKEEDKLLVVLQKKAEQWGNEYYERVAKKISDHEKRVKEIYDRIKQERDKYPHKSVIDLNKFRELTARIKEKEYDKRCCFVTRLSYKEDVLGVGLEIVPEGDTGRNVFQCSFDLLSKEAFQDFGIRSGVWKEKVQFWMPAAIDASHFRRALPHLAACFKQLGDGKVEALTRSYGTQAGSAKYNLKAQLREAERKGQKIVSLEDYRKAQAERKLRVPIATGPPSEAPSDEAPPSLAVQAAPISAMSLTEADVAYGLEVLPKLMNLQTVQLMKGDLHLSTKALEGYMGFHHLLLSILRQFPSLQSQVERKIAAFLVDEKFRSKKACPNIGEFLCLFAVSRKYTWDDVSKAVLKETLDRNASWAIDKFESLKQPGISAEVRLEKTFRASIVSIRLLCFNVWFLRNIVFKKYGEAATAESIVADKSSGVKVKNQVDRKWEEYEERKGIPKQYEVDMLQEEMKKMLLRGDGLNSWRDYFVMLNLKPPPAHELSQFLRTCLNDAVRKGYIPLWKMRPKAPKEKAPAKDDHLGNDVDKLDGMFTKSSANKW